MEVVASGESILGRVRTRAKLEPVDEATSFHLPHRLRTDEGQSAKILSLNFDQSRELLLIYTLLIADEQLLVPPSPRQQHA